MINRFSRIHRWNLSYCKLRYYSRIANKVKHQPRWEAVIGLEIHAQIASKTKLFSAAGTQFAASINSQVAYFDAALPGTLPVINMQCVRAGVLTAHAINAHINLVSTFDRKHYFYADLPAGYQITQQRQPLAVGGYVMYTVPASDAREPSQHTARITQLQLEQDSGKSLHDPMEAISLIDLNRAGVGLMEIVTEPEFRSAEQAVAFVKELQLILIAIGTCSGKMDEGALRVDASISVHKPDEPLGTRAEVKNLNSLRYVSKAIDFEINRQIDLLENGGEVANETRAYDFESGETVAMRDKERIHDYRFMPEPNLPPLRLYMDATATTCSDPQIINVDALRRELPELPADRRLRLVSQYGITLAQAAYLVNEFALVNYFEAAMEGGDRSAKVVLNLLLNELLGTLNKANVSIEDSPVTAVQLGEIAALLENKNISMAIAKKLLMLLCDGESRSVTQLVKDNKWTQLTDAHALEAFCDTVISDNEAVVTQYKQGKTKVFNFLVAQVMKATQGRAEPTMVTNILKKKLA